MVLRDGDIFFVEGRLNRSEIVVENIKLYGGFLSFVALECYYIYIESSDIQFEIDFSFSRITCLEFKQSIIRSNLKFEDCLIEMLVFENCINYSLLNIGWNEKQIEPTGKYFSTIREIGYFGDEERDSKTARHHRAAETALLLKENFRKMGRYEDEDCAYYTYKKHDIRAEHYGKSFWKRMFDKPGFWFKLLVYELIGGYGTRPVRIFYTMLATVGIFALIYHVILAYGGTIKNLSCGGIFDWKALSCSLYFSAITFLTIGYGDLSPAHWSIRTLASIEGLIGLLLISYFTIAFSRKVLR